MALLCGARELPDGIHGLGGVDDSGQPFSYKLAVRKTPQVWFFLAYDMTQTIRGQEQFNRGIYGAVVVFTLLSLLVGWWAASRVMSPVSELANRLKKSSGRSTTPVSLAGIPAVSIPCGLSEGLPVGLQVIGPAFSETRILDAAHALEGALGFEGVPRG